MKLGSNCLCPRIGLVLLAYALAQGFWLLVLTHLRDKCAVEEAKKFRPKLRTTHTQVDQRTKKRQVAPAAFQVDEALYSVSCYGVQDTLPEPLTHWALSSAEIGFGSATEFKVPVTVQLLVDPPLSRAASKPIY